MGLLAQLLSLLSASVLVSCGGAPIEPPKAEHDARKLSPVPACAQVLPTVGREDVRVSLRDEYWKLIFPAFDEEDGWLPPDALACTGRAVLNDESFRGSSLARKVTDAEITLGSGADGIKPVWLRSHPISETEVAGALALVRVHEQFVYVVAVGAHRGRHKARLAIDRLGAELLLLVRDEGCKGRKPNQPCQSDLTVYLVRQGELVKGTKVTLERVASGDGEVVGKRGVSYHLKASPSFASDELRVVEQVTVRDQAGRQLRWAEQQRVFVVMGDSFEPSDEPLWSRMVRRQTTEVNKP